MCLAFSQSSPNINMSRPSFILLTLRNSSPAYGQYGQIDRQIDGWMDGWTDRRMINESMDR